MILKIEIELGNDEMQRWSEVRAAIHAALAPAKLAQNASSLTRPYRNDAGHIFDVNGNTVGDWRVSE